MTRDELRLKLVSDPDFIFSYIYANNPNAVIENIRGLGEIVENDDQVFDVINGLIEDGRQDLVEQIMTVPMVTENLDPGALAVMGELAATSSTRKTGLDAASWAAIAAAGVTLVGVLTGNKGNKPVEQVPTNSNTTATKKNNTTLYVVIGGAVVVAIVLLIVFRTGK